MCKIKLSSKQQEIASLKDGAILVRASAGSGKTRVLVERIKMLAGMTKRTKIAPSFNDAISCCLEDNFILHMAYVLFYYIK